MSRNLTFGIDVEIFFADFLFLKKANFFIAKYQIITNLKKKKFYF